MKPVACVGIESNGLVAELHVGVVKVEAEFARPGRRVHLERRVGDGLARRRFLGREFAKPEQRVGAHRNRI